MKSTESDAYRFADFALHPQERVLTVRGTPTPIGSRAFDVLLALVQHAGRAVSRNTLIDAAWPGLVVEENNLSVQISALRGVLGRQAITTIPGIGYRFSAALERSAPASIAQEQPEAAPRRAGNILPFQAELIGREAVLDEVAALVGQHRLVTLSGPGGIGKTRLAQAIGRQFADRYEAGAWIVEFAPLADASLLAATVARTLGLRLPGERPVFEELADALGETPRLLILDNCEHVVDEAGPLATALLERTRGVRLLATSQELLKVRDEHVYRLPPLSVPPPDAPTVTDHGAVRLLVARVESRAPRFVFDAAGMQDAAEICRRLDGLPLAIELAAARVPLLGLSTVRARLDDRLQVLTDGARSGLPRHRALRATLDWSQRLLNEPERRAFARAGVFTGTFGLEQAERMLGDEPGDRDGDADPGTIEHIGSLVDKSLIMVDSTDPPRYRLLESARLYTRAMRRASGETELAQRRHACVFRDLFQESLALEWQQQSQERRRRFLPELDNGRAALDWAADADQVLHAGLASSMAWLFGSSGHGTEGLRHCWRALDQIAELARDGNSRVPPGVEARLLVETCRLNHGAPSEQNLPLSARAVDLLREQGDAPLLYTALGRLAVDATRCGDCAQGELAIQQMAALHSRSWPPMSRWELLNARDYLANELGLYSEGESIAREELALARAQGDTAKILFSLMAAEQCAASLERYEEAVERGRELVELAEREGEVEHAHVYVFNLAMALAMCGRIGEALPLARQSAELDRRHGSLWKGLDLMALLALRQQRVELAAQIVGRSDAMMAWRNGQREPVESNVYRAVIAALDEAMGADALADWKARGASLSDDEATERALAT